MNKKIIVWDLFGGGQNSIYHALHSDQKYEIYTFDVTISYHDKQFIVNLAQGDIIKKMEYFPKPEIITSSTLCQSFSCVLNMKGGGTCFWKLNDKKDSLIFRTISEFNKLKSGFTKHLDAKTQLFIAKLGKKCIDNTIKLIQHYKPKYWFIENPKHSLLWKYIILNKKNFYKKETMFFNEASYGKYGYLTTKATYFLSNAKMLLLKGKIEPPYTIETDKNGIKWYVLKDDKTVKLRKDLDSRMIGLANIKKIIKARKVKSGLGGMDFIMRNAKQPSMKNKKTNAQISEATPASAIPSNLIKDIFKNFKF